MYGTGFLHVKSVCTITADYSKTKSRGSELINGELLDFVMLSFEHILCRCGCVTNDSQVEAAWEQLNNC